MSGFPNAFLYFFFLFSNTQVTCAHCCRKILPCNISKKIMTWQGPTLPRRAELSQPSCLPCLGCGWCWTTCIVPSVGWCDTLSWSMLSLCSASRQAKAGRSLLMVTISDTNFSIKLSCSIWHLKTMAIPKVPNFYSSTYSLGEFLFLGIFGCRKWNRGGLSDSLNGCLLQIFTSLSLSLFLVKLVGINPIPISKIGKYIVKSKFQCWYWLRWRPESLKTVPAAFRWNNRYAVAFPDVQAWGGRLDSHIFSHISANGEVPRPTVNVNIQ